MAVSLESYISRYAVPFYFDSENGGYSKIVDHLRNKVRESEDAGSHSGSKWKEAGFWENYKKEKKGSKFTRPEMDIYTYLLDMFKDDPENTDGSNIGASFTFVSKEPFLKLKYKKDKESAPIGINCTDIGLIIFRNGVGFIWYDITFDSDIPSEGDVEVNISLEDYISFQKNFKELARTSEKCITDENDKVFCMGKFLAKFLDTEKLGIRFWAERKGHNEDKTTILMPDKALLFQYLCVDKADTSELVEIAFYAANGYDRKYVVPRKMAEEVYEPFGNIAEYTSKGGMAYIASAEGSSAAFLKKGFKDKFKTDYFFIYVLLLYQSYSCGHYSKILTKLPADVKAIESDVKYVELLESLDTAINLFLVKSFFESVSNVRHQNETYLYAKKVLKIDEDINSLTAGLSALRKISASSS